MFGIKRQEALGTVIESGENLLKRAFFRRRNVVQDDASNDEVEEEKRARMLDRREQTGSRKSEVFHNFIL